MNPLHAALVAEVRHVHPNYKLKPDAAPQHEILTIPEPCESCGTTVIGVRASRGARPYEIGPLNASRSAVRFLYHGPRRCWAARKRATR